LQLLGVSAINHDEEAARAPGVGKKAWNDPAGRRPAAVTVGKGPAVP
jgi:hypothetical protein